MRLKGSLSKLNTIKLSGFMKQGFLGKSQPWLKLEKTLATFMQLLQTRQLKVHWEFSLNLWSTVMPAWLQAEALTGVLSLRSSRKLRTQVTCTFRRRNSGQFHSARTTTRGTWSRSMRRHLWRRTLVLLRRLLSQSSSTFTIKHRAKTSLKWTPQQ